MRGQLLPVPKLPALLALHKPAGVLGVLDRDAARARTSGPVALTDAVSLGDLIPREWLTGDLGLYGRLDKQTTGLVLLGRDGGIGSLLLQPQHHVSKTSVDLCVCVTLESTAHSQGPKGQA